MTFEQVNKNIVFKLINMERNSELLERVPFIQKLDLAIIFYVYMPGQNADEEFRVGLIDNVLMESWGTDVDLLMKYARENTARILGLRVRGIFSTIASYTKDKALEEIAEEEDKLTPLYVATNNIETFGASVMLYQDMLKTFAENKKSDIYVIPCSVHELILIPSVLCEGINEESIKDMIAMVNSTELSEEDVLSDSLYFYNRELDTLSVIE